MKTHFTRREILAAFLGLPAALSACNSAQAPRFPDGAIVGSSDAFGHRLREPPPPPPAGRLQKTGVVIVGGGIAGLSAAWRFLRAGFEDFIVLELESDAGGTSRSGASAVASYPWGAHYIPAPLKENKPLIALLEEMDLLEGQDTDGQPIVAEQYLCRDPQERLFFLDRWYEGLYLHAGETAEDRRQFHEFHKAVDAWVDWRDGRGRRAFTLPVAACSDDADATALDQLSMAEWLDQRGYTSSRLRWLVDYGCRDDYGTSLQDTSAWAGLFYFASRQKQAGADAQPLMTWPEGNGRVVKHFYEKAKAHVRLGLAACDIAPQEKGVEVIALRQQNGTVEGLHADQVVFAAPQFLTPYVIRPYRGNPPKHVAAFEYGAWLVANLTLKDRPRDRGFPLAWDNVLYESPSLGYVVATHQMGVDFGPTVFTYYYPMCDTDPQAARKRLLSLDWRTWADVVLTDLGRAHRRIRELVERLDVMRWGHAMIRPRPGFLWGAARRAAVQPDRGIHFAHSDLSGVALFEEAFYQGLRAAEEVLRARGWRFDAMIT